MKDFKKEDLKDGMVVSLNNGKKFMKLGDYFKNLDEWIPLYYYSNELTNLGDKKFDVVSVFYASDRKGKITEALDVEKEDLIWQRTETKRMTAEEMRQKLEELTGEKIEVAKELSRNEMIGVLYQYCDTKPLCHGCCLNYGSSCSFHTYTDEVLKKCYKKVMEDETI